MIVVRRQLPHVFEDFLKVVYNQYNPIDYQADKTAEKRIYWYGYPLKYMVYS